jgi:DNA-binding beta-propeller fold protein YncE
MSNVVKVLQKRSISSVNILFLTLVIFLAYGFAGGAAAARSAGEPAYAAKRTLVKGSAIHGANGIAFGPDGLLYVTSAVGSTISVIDPESGKILKTLGQAEGIVGPDDIAFGPDGALYWTGFFTGQVGRLTPDGAAQVVGNVGPGANAIGLFRRRQAVCHPRVPRRRPL